MADKKGSNRYGWNQRGPTPQMQMAKAKEYSNPESYYWRNKTQNLKHALIDAMGEAEFLEWAERLFPGDSIDGVTWKEIAELYEAKLHVVQAGLEECNCVLPEQSCPICEAITRKIYGDVIGG